jgi:tetratricopeptide (TPR) repeat protein/tRNA A-37 threonylcarbamoyl transferase component Bud32
MPADGEGDASLDETVIATPELAATQPSLGGGAPGAVPDIARGATIGRYVVLEQIGSGSMGIVVAAYDPTLDRRVAIKLVRADITGSSIGRQRLLREAQAMAKLSHPNVVTVFEADTVGDQVFLAMEYVAGSTLDDWCEKHGQDEIIGAFVDAGRGLAAAHAAGIIHRDFKPNNVLVSTDGRVRVADFGLATATLSDEDRTVGTTSLTSLSMTATGAVLGTPAYMAPEQHHGKPADARADQFAFCVALYEALYGQLPFAGDDYPSYSSSVTSGEMREAPRGAVVPGRIRRVLARGLAREPAARYPGMTELLAELDRAPPASRRRAAIVSAAALGAVAVAVVAGTAAAGDPCANAAPSLTGTWDPDLRARIHAAFTAVSPASGHATAERIAGAFERRADELGAMRRDACLATHVRRDQSATLLDRRMHCLDLRTAELAALVKVFAETPDARVVEGAVTAALSLPSLARCADRTQLLAAIAAPDDPTVRTQVEQLDRELVTVRALSSAGKFGEAFAAVDAVTTRADALGYVPLRARAHHLRGVLLARLEKGDQAVAASHVAGRLAAEARDDALLAEIWVLLYALTGSDLSLPSEARAMEPIVDAALVRGGNDPALRGNLEQSRGAIHIRLGDYGAAADSFLAAERAFAAGLGPSHPQVANALANAATALTQAGRYDEARAALDRAIAINIEAYGPDDLHVARVLDGLGTLADFTGHPEESLEHFRKALAISEKILPAGHAKLATLHDSLGVQLDKLRRYDEALAEHRRALEILETDPKNNAARLASALANLAVTLQNVGDVAAALASYERALGIQEALMGPDHPDVADTLATMGIAWIRAGDATRARTAWKRALAIRIAKLGEKHVDTAVAYALLAEEASTRGAHREALELVGRSLAGFEAAGVENAYGYADAFELRGTVRARLGQYADAAADLAQARDRYGTIGRDKDAAGMAAKLAEAQWAAGGSARRAALRTARDALARYDALGATDEAAGVRRWIAKHGGE